MEYSKLRDLIEATNIYIAVRRRYITEEIYKSVWFEMLHLEPVHVLP